MSTTDGKTEIALGQCNMVCDNKNSLGFCKSTACINPKAAIMGKVELVRRMEGWELPFINKIEVVRCKECKYYPMPDGIAHVCEYWGKITNEMGFCSNARKKEK